MSVRPSRSGRSPPPSQSPAGPAGPARAASEGILQDRSPKTRSAVAQRVASVHTRTAPPRARARELPRAPSCRRRRETWLRDLAGQRAGPGRSASRKRPGRGATRPRPQPRTARKPSRTARKEGAGVYPSRSLKATRRDNRRGTGFGPVPRDTISWCCLGYSVAQNAAVLAALEDTFRLPLELAHPLARDLQFVPELGECGRVPIIEAVAPD